MPRVKLRSDDEVLDAAAAVMRAHGPDFTLADVAERAGIAPSTLIQRFGDKRGLVVRAARRENLRFAAALADAPRAKGVEAVVDLFWSLTPGEGDEAALADQLLWLSQDLRDPELNSLARERFALLRQALAERLPPLRIPEATALRLLVAQWQGALVQWGVEPTGALGDFVAQSLGAWMEAVEIPPG